MNLQDVLYSLIGKTNPGLSAEPHCPDEAEMLSYLEESTSSGRCAKLETHFANCDDCRELLTLYVQVSSERTMDETLLTEETITCQTTRILASIKEDDIKLAEAAGGKDKHRISSPVRAFISYKQFAAVMAVFILSTVVVYQVFLSPSPSKVAMEAIELTVKGERTIPLRISGDFPYSPYNKSATRGEEEVEKKLQLEVALLDLKSAEDPSASDDELMVRARVHLTRDKEGDTEFALGILQKLADRGNDAPELFNDTGVALYLTGKYREAISQFDKALAKSPDYDEALFNRALAKERDGRYEEARRDLEQFIKLDTEKGWKDEAKKRLASLPAPQ